MQHTLLNQNHACTTAALKLQKQEALRCPLPSGCRCKAAPSQLFESSLVLTMLSCGISTVFMRGFLLVLTHSASWKSPCTRAWRGAQGATGSVCTNDSVKVGLAPRTLPSDSLSLRCLPAWPPAVQTPHLGAPLLPCLRPFFLLQPNSNPASIPPMAPPSLHPTCYLRQPQ